MRLDARKGDTGWNVFDVPRCAEVKCCVWVDSDTATYGAWGSHPGLLDAFLGEPPVHQAKLIRIDRRAASVFAAVFVTILVSNFSESALFRGVVFNFFLLVMCSTRVSTLVSRR